MYVFFSAKRRYSSMKGVSKISVKAIDSVGNNYACSDLYWDSLANYYGYGYSDCGSVTVKRIELTFVV